ncbi:VWA domain-containing protein, partial [Actinoplanes philippinensis]|uniref:VWA domain-containing protein n=1 Tax=Actinoplanes philippinensis TaxID=35752 RepID=UPI0033EA4176
PGAPPVSQGPPADAPSTATAADSSTAPAADAGAAPPGEEAPPHPAGALAVAGPAYRTRTLRITARGEGGHAGRRSPAFARRGRVVGSRPPQGKLTGAPHLFATLRAALDRAALESAPSGSAPLDGASLDGAPLNGAALDGIPLNGAALDGIPLNGAALDGIPLNGAALDGAPLNGAPLDSAPLGSTPFDSAPLGDAGFDRAAEGAAVGDRVRLVAGNAAPTGGVPRNTGTRGIRVLPRDLRESVHVGREANLVLFVVDASGSMAARKRMTLVKTAVLSLLRDAYQRRDRIGMITFRGADADVVLPPTSSHEVGVQRLAALRTGGRTPLAAGLRAAAATIATERRRDPRRRPLLIIVTDGRATSGPDPLLLAPALSGVASVVVDCESGPIRLGLARRLAAALNADVMPLDHLEAATVRRGPGTGRDTVPAGAPTRDRAYRRAA